MTGGIDAVKVWVLVVVKGCLLWCLGSLAGCVVFGIAPATIALTDQVRRYLRGQQSTVTWRGFWESYVKDFRESHEVLDPLFLLLVVAVSNAGRSEAGWYWASLAGVYLCMMLLLWSAAVWSHHHTTVRGAWRAAAFFILWRPISTMALVVFLSLHLMMLAMWPFPAVVLAPALVIVGAVVGVRTLEDNQHRLPVPEAEEPVRLPVDPLSLR